MRAGSPNVSSFLGSKNENGCKELLSAFQFCFDAKLGMGDRFQPAFGNFFARHLANAVGFIVNAV
jgi:hypothetical protein